jgi:hypothetical protein
MSQELEISQQLIHKYFGLPSEDLANEYEAVLEPLKKQIQYLLNEDFQALLNAMYRIDVDENKFKIALEFSRPSQMAENIGRLILDRIVVKAQTRLKYS